MDVQTKVWTPDLLIYFNRTCFISYVYLGKMSDDDLGGLDDEGLSLGDDDLGGLDDTAAGDEAELSATIPYIIY